MFVGRVRRRAAQRRPSSKATAIAATVCTIMLATSCAAVEDAIGSSDASETTVEEQAVTTTAAPVFEPDAYCALSHEADQLNAGFTAFDDPAALEAFFGQLVGLLNEATPPPEVQAQFVTLRTAYVDLQTQLAAGGYDPAVLSTSPILSDATVNAAITAVDQHDLALCGVAPGLESEAAAGDEPVEGDGTASDPFAEALATGDFSAMEEVLATEVGRQAFIEGMTETSPGVTAEQAACILDNSDIAVLAEMSMTPDNLSPESVEAFLATLEVCGVELSAFQTQ